MKQLLVIGKVWPEPNSSAAGQRILELLDFFKSKAYKICFASTASQTEHTSLPENLNIDARKIKVNDAAFDDFLKEINPDVVLFDRFTTEEQFGWRIDKSAPDTIKILDTEDLHFLRDARKEAFEKNIAVEDLMLQSEIAKREIAAIYRCDLSLIISEVELQLLTDTFKIPSFLLFYLPFLLEKITDEEIKNFPEFQQRKDFISIGNFLHKPNKHAVIYLKEKVWPKIRKHLPEANLHIYGAYPTQQILEMHQPKNGFLVHGRTDNAVGIMQKARILLAPLQFGAGLKGKLILAMQNGTPSITTKTGAEGMNGQLPWNGKITDDRAEFIQAAIKLYNDQQQWNKFRKNGFRIINERFSRMDFYILFDKKLVELNSDLTSHRLQNFTGAMLKHHLHRSTYFMSRFIEEKNRR